jgi:hypothetical protein
MVIYAQSFAERLKDSPKETFESAFFIVTWSKGFIPPRFLMPACVSD